MIVMDEKRRKTATFVLVLALFGALWWNQNRGLQAVATETHAALCAFKHDLQLRRDNAAQILRDEKGPVIFGIPRSVIQNSVTNQEATLHSLKELTC